jgi:hypothetical protein
VGYYSFVVIAKNPVAIEDPLICLDKGVNTFAAVVQDLQALLDRLSCESVEVKQVNQLDELDPVDPNDSLLLPGETLNDHLQLPSCETPNHR